MKLRKVFSLMLAILMMLSSASALAGVVTDEPVTYTFMRSENAAVPHKDDTPAYRAVEEITGVKLDITQISSADFNTKMMALYAANNMPDIFSGTFGMSKREMVEDGALLDLTDLIEEYAPNIKALYEQSPDLNRTRVDGRIYSLPRYRFDQNLEAGCSPFIRMDLLEESGLPIPTTWDELYDTLLILMEKYDMIGWGARGTGRILGTSTFLWMDSFGADYGAYKDDEGTWHIGRTEPEYKDAIEFLNKLVSSNVLDPEFVNMSSTQWQEGLSSGKYLFWYDNATFAAGVNSALANFDPDAYFAPLPLLENPYGETQSYKQPDHYTDQFFVDAGVEDPVTLIKFLDWCYSEEAAVIFAYGREGETFAYDENGQPYYLPEVIEHYVAMEDSYYQACSELGVNNCYFTPAWLNLATEAFRLSDGNTIDAQYIFDFYKEDLLDGTIVERPVEPPLTPEQDQRINEIKQAVNDLSKTEFTKFVMGTRPMEEYDAFIEELRAKGIDEWAQILNEAEAAYQALGF